jgi:hypothetical protein
MTEKEIRLNEVEVLQIFLDRNGITNDTMHNYARERRRVINVDFPDAQPVDAAKEEAEVEAAIQAGSEGNEPAPKTPGQGPQSPAPVEPVPTTVEEVPASA